MEYRLKCRLAVVDDDVAAVGVQTGGPGGLRHPLAERDHPAQHRCRGVGQIDVVVLGNDQRVTADHRADIQEGQVVVVLVDPDRQSFAGDDGRFSLKRAVGCKDCTQGYRGRVGLHELMLGSDAIKRLVQERGRVSQVFGQALSEGMRTLRQDGMEKVLMGITDMKQVRKVCVR